MTEKVKEFFWNVIHFLNFIFGIANIYAFIWWATQHFRIV